MLQDVGNYALFDFKEEVNRENMYVEMSFMRLA